MLVRHSDKTSVHTLALELSTQLEAQQLLLVLLIPLCVCDSRWLHRLFILSTGRVFLSPEAVTILLQGDRVGISMGDGVGWDLTHLRGGTACSSTEIRSHRHPV